jgi:hypothetical protein
VWIGVAGVLLVGGLVIVIVARSAHGGQKTERGAVEAYVSAVNAMDEKALADVLSPGGDAVVRNILFTTQRPIVASGIDVEHQFPDVANAYLVGTAAGQSWQLTLQLARNDGRWYVATGPVEPDSDSGPTAATSGP